MSEALLLVAEGYEQIAAGIRKMIAAQKDTSKKEEKPVKKAEKRENPVADTPKDEAAPKETASRPRLCQCQPRPRSDYDTFHGRSYEMGQYHRYRRKSSSGSC